jgi:hypothetical protein
VSRRVASWVAALTLTLHTACAIAGTVFNHLNPADDEPLVTEIALLTAFGSFAFVGALIVWRRPEHLVGWIFCSIAVLSGLAFFAGEYATYALFTNPGSLPGGTFAAWLQTWPWDPILALAAVYLPLVFPNGRLLSPRWRIVAWLTAASVVAVSVAFAFAPELELDVPEGSAAVANPVGVESAEEALARLGDLAVMLLVAMVILAALSLVLRFRRADAVEREQVKWFAMSVAFFAAAAVLSVTFLGEAVPTLADLAIAAALACMPIATGVAVLRYRLYEIDRIINRTLVYGLVTVVLSLTYLALVVGLQALFEPFTGGSDIAIALTTLVVAALFFPLRRRVQDAVDSRFNRRRYDAARTLQSFSARLRDELDMETLEGNVVAVVNQTVQPAHVSIWLRDPAAIATSGRASSG